VDILTALEGPQQHGILGQGRHHPQLDLAVVRVQQHPARLGHEGSANGTALLGADGNVLEIGIAGGQAPRGDCGLVQPGVEAAGHGIHQRREGLDVGPQKLLHLAVDQELGGDLPILALGEFRQDVLIRGRSLGLVRALEDGEAQLVVEDLPQLGRAVEVEGLSRQFQHPGLRSIPLPVEVLGDGGEHLHIEPHAHQFQLRQDLHQGQIHLVIEPFQVQPWEHGLQFVAELQR